MTGGGEGAGSSSSRTMAFTSARISLLVTERGTAGYKIKTYHIVSCSIRDINYEAHCRSLDLIAVNSGLGFD
jgi:hypothetical protein